MDLDGQRSELAECVGHGVDRVGDDECISGIGFHPSGVDAAFGLVL